MKKVVIVLMMLLIFVVSAKAQMDSGMKGEQKEQDSQSMKMDEGMMKQMMEKCQPMMKQMMADKKDMMQMIDGHDDHAGKDDEGA